MSPLSALSTPLRKSGATRLFQTPQSIVREQPANDDEEERRLRRSEASLDDSFSTNSTLAQDNENIKMCLKLYSDNKLSKDNAWSLTIIDSFAKLMSRHSKSMQNFQVAGSTLEASTKVYGLRVDSVHTDVMRMSSELTRQTARAMGSNAPADDDDDDTGGGDDSFADGGGNKENNAGENDQQRPKAKKKRTRKLVSTVTKSKDSINAVLDTIPFTDPFFAKLNSVVGDVNSSSRLMQNIVPTHNSELRLRMDYPFWDAKGSPKLDLDGPEEPFEAGDEVCRLHVARAIGLDNPLHELHRGYIITDAPADDDEKDMDDERRGNATAYDPGLYDMEARSNEAGMLNRSALDVQFDINAEVAPVPTEDAFILDYDAKDIDGNDDFAEDDELALEQCKGLMRKTIQIEDMRPIDSSCSTLEYSYRPLDNISQFWAGPAHWKFKRSTRARSTIAAQLSGADSGGGSLAKERGGRRKKRFELDTLDDVLSVDANLFQPYDPNRPIKGITIQKNSICKKWDSKKLKLPTNFHLDRDRFDKWHYALGLHVRDFVRNAAGAIEPAPSEEYNCETGDDHTSCGNDMDDGRDDDLDHGGNLLPDAHVGDLPNASAAGPTQQLNATVDVISTEFEGAPEKIAKINIAYAKKAKPIDMKQLKNGCWRVISSHLAADAPLTQPTQDTQTDPLPAPALSQAANLSGPLRFSRVYAKVPQLLSKTMSENVSKSLAFYAVLHLANEKKLKLQGQKDLQDFTIEMYTRPAALFDTDS
ncbi:condensin complex subunit 2 [Anopheles cruzii]|uniref:condensin complex subunit 2 n=1 Tax=Anopheles cruzii TaxID=68878 RepID=UPI0022EC855A|nr:condensin complex subunit 2 [Anopheles cruzii]